MLPFLQVVCPMEEDTRAPCMPMCSRPQSEPKPCRPLHSLVTCREQKDDVGKKEVRRRSGRLQLTKDHELLRKRQEGRRTIQRGLGPSSSLAKRRMANSTTQSMKSLSIKLIKPDSPLKQQKNEDVAEDTRSSSQQEQRGLTMPKGGCTARCEDQAASAVQEEDFVTGNAKADLKSGQSELGLEPSEPPESPMVVKQWVIGPLIQSFKSKMASFTEIVMTPVRFFKSNPSASTCHDCQVLMNPTVDSDSSLNTLKLCPEHQTEGGRTEIESSSVDVDRCFTSSIAKSTLKREISTGINDPCPSLSDGSTDRALRSAVRKPSAVQRLNFDAETKVDKAVQDRDFLCFDEQNGDGVVLPVMDGKGYSSTDDQSVSVIEKEPRVDSVLCLRHRSGMEKRADSQPDSLCEDFDSAKLQSSLSSSPGTAQQMEPYILLRRLDCKHASDCDDATADCPHKRLSFSTAKADLPSESEDIQVFSEAESVLLDLKESVLKDAFRPVIQETNLSVGSKPLTPLMYHMTCDSLSLSDNGEKEDIRQLRFLDNDGDRHTSTLNSQDWRETDLERNECPTPHSSLSKTSPSSEKNEGLFVPSLAENELVYGYQEEPQLTQPVAIGCPSPSPLMRAPSDTEEEVEAEGDQKANGRVNLVKRMKKNEREGVRIGESVSTSTQKTRCARWQQQKRRGRTCHVNENEGVVGEVSVNMENGERGSHKARRSTCKRHQSLVTELTPSTAERLNCLKSPHLDLSNGSSWKRGIDSNVRKNIVDKRKRKHKNKGKMLSYPEPYNAVRAKHCQLPSEEGAAFLGGVKLPTDSRDACEAMIITVAREEGGEMVKSSTPDTLNDRKSSSILSQGRQTSKCRKRALTPEAAMDLTANCKQALVVLEDFGHGLQLKDLKEETTEARGDGARVKSDQRLARRLKHKNFCSAADKPKKLCDGLQEKEDVSVEAQTAQSEGLNEGYRERGTLESRDSSATELDPKEPCQQSDSRLYVSVIAPQSPFKNITPCTSSLNPSSACYDYPAVVEGKSVDGHASHGKAGQSRSETLAPSKVPECTERCPADQIGHDGFPSGDCGEGTMICCSHVPLVRAAVVRLKRVETYSEEEKEPGKIRGNGFGGPKRLMEHEGQDNAQEMVEQQVEVCPLEASGHCPLPTRLLRSRSCPEIPSSLLEDPWITPLCPSPQHSGRPPPTLQQHSLVHAPPPPARRTRRYTVCSMEVEREIAPLCLRKEVYPAGFSATSPSFTPLTVLASCFLSSSLAFRSQKQDGSCRHSGTSSGGSSSHTTCPFTTSWSSHKSPASSIVNLFSSSSTPAHLQTGQPPASVSSLCSSSSQVSLEERSPDRLRQEATRSQSFETPEDKAFSDLEVKQVDAIKRGEQGKVSRIKIRRTVPKPPTNLTPMGLPRPVRLKKKEFSLEEIYTNKNFQSPPEGRLETIFEVPISCRDGSLTLISQRRFKRLVEFPELGMVRKPKRPLIGTCGGASWKAGGKPTLGRTRRGGGARGKEGPILSLQELDSLLCAKLSQLESWIAFDQEGELT